MGIQTENLIQSSSLPINPAQTSGGSSSNSSGVKNLNSENSSALPFVPFAPPASNRHMSLVEGADVYFVDDDFEFSS